MEKHTNNTTAVAHGTVTDADGRPSDQYTVNDGAPLTKSERDGYNHDFDVYGDAEGDSTHTITRIPDKQLICCSTISHHALVEGGGLDAC